MFLKFSLLIIYVFGMAEFANGSVRDIIDCFTNGKVLTGCNLGKNTIQRIKSVADGKKDFFHVFQALNDLYKSMNDCLEKNVEQFCSKSVADIVKKMGNKFKKDAILPF